MSTCTALPRRLPPTTIWRSSLHHPLPRDGQPALIGKKYVTERDSAPVQYNGIVYHSRYWCTMSCSYPFRPIRAGCPSLPLPPHRPPLAASWTMSPRRALSLGAPQPALIGHATRVEPQYYSVPAPAMYTQCHCIVLLYYQHTITHSGIQCRPITRSGCGGALPFLPPSSSTAWQSSAGRTKSATKNPSVKGSSSFSGLCR